MRTWKNKTAIGVALVALLVLAVSCEGPTTPPDPGATPPLGATCPYENDGTCDVDLGLCPAGTDVDDCAPTEPTGPDPVTSDLPCMDRDSPAAVGDCIAECLTVTVPDGAYRVPHNPKSWVYIAEIVNSCDVALSVGGASVATTSAEVAALWEAFYTERGYPYFTQYYQLIDGTWWNGRGGIDARIILHNETRRDFGRWLEYPHPHSGTPPDSFRLRWCTTVTNYIDAQTGVEGRDRSNYADAMNARFGPDPAGPESHIARWCIDMEEYTPGRHYIDGVFEWFHHGVIYDGGNHRELTVYRKTSE